MDATIQPVLLPAAKSRNPKRSPSCLLVNSRLTWVVIAVHVSAAFVCIGVQVAMFSYDRWYNPIAFRDVCHGLWCGVVFLATGIVGIVAVRTKYYCPTVGFAVMSLVSALFVLPLFGLALAGFFRDCRENYYDDSKGLGARLLLHVTLFSMAVLEGLVSSYSALKTINTILKYDKQNKTKEYVPMMDKLSDGSQLIVVPGQGQTVPVFRATMSAAGVSQ